MKIWFAAASCLLASSLALAQGLGLRGGPDPKAVAFEADLVRAIQDARKKQGKEPLAADEGLRMLLRKEAEHAARGAPEHKTFEPRVKAAVKDALSHRIQFGYGTEAAKVLRDLEKDASWKSLVVSDDVTRLAVGAFYVPDTPPYFQFAVLVVQDKDPLAGKPGLERKDTDPVMQKATPEISKCYDAVLKRDPNVRGDVLFQIVIGAGGKVSEAKVLKSLGDVLFDACALQVVRALAFPAPYKNKPVTLNHPMRFTPPQGETRVGRLTPAQVQSAFGIASTDFKRCYDERRAEKPNLAGTILLDVDVTAEGAIATLRIKSDEPGDAALTQCVSERAKQVRFPIPEFAAPLTLTYPLKFEPPLFKK